MTCPDCDGSGRFYALVKYAVGGCQLEGLHCRRCSGSGSVPEEQRGWILDGQAMREARQARDKSLGEEARERGMTVVELSDMERGKIQPRPR